VHADEVPTIQLGPLRARRVVMPLSGVTRESAGQTVPLTCVLCHGFGAPGDDLVGLAAGLRAPPGTAFVFPEAPLALPVPEPHALFGQPRAWWLIDIAAIERARMRGEIRDLSKSVPIGLSAARAALVAMLDELQAKHPSSRLVLGGFSQGAMLALDVALHDPRPLAGLVLLSGTLVSEAEWTRLLGTALRRGLPVFQSHGTSDPLLPFSLAERLRDLLTSAGLDVTFDAFEEGHTIPLSTLARLRTWVREVGLRGAPDV
jgi:phospholipase/carboxylesterase